MAHLPRREERREGAGPGGHRAHHHHCHAHLHWIAPTTTRPPRLDEKYMAGLAEISRSMAGRKTLGNACCPNVHVYEFISACWLLRMYAVSRYRGNGPLRACAGSALHHPARPAFVLPPPFCPRLSSPYVTRFISSPQRPAPQLPRSTVHHSVQPRSSPDPQFRQSLPAASPTAPQISVSLSASLQFCDTQPLIGLPCPVSTAARRRPRHG